MTGRSRSGWTRQNATADFRRARRRCIHSAVDRLNAALEAGDELWGVTVVRTEILAGARPPELEAIARLLGLIRWLDVTPELADAAGRLASTYLRSHPGVDTVDYLVAAGTEHLGAELLTMDVRHFPMFPKSLPAY